MTGERVERRLVAILAADIVGYSRLMGLDEEGTLARLKRCRTTLLDPEIAGHRGRIVKTTGDGLLVEFASAVDAVRCAAAVQRGMIGFNAELPHDRWIEFRIGINLGDIIVDGDDIFGDGVNVAARLESIADPGGIAISRAVYDQIRGRVDITFEDRGDTELKNIARPVHVFAARLNGANTENAGARPPLALPDKPSIAVLAFKNMSGDPEQEYFADGMVEDIITALSRKRQLFVIARNSSFTYKGKSVDTKQVGRELGVRYILEGSVRKAAHRVRITGQLIDAATGTHLWADKFDGNLDDIFELQDQVTSHVVGAILPQLDLAEIARAQRKPTGSLQAYDYFLRGMSHNNRFTREGSEAAFPLFQKATELDPDFALAHASIAQWFTQRRAWGWSATPEQDAIDAVGAAEKALALAKDDAMVLACSGWALLFFADRGADASAYLDAAIALDPNLAVAWTWGGLTKAMLGQHRAAIEYCRRAIRLSPLDPRNFLAYNGLGYASFFLGENEAASEFVAASLRLQPHFISTLRLAIACHAQCGRIAEARQIWAALTARAPAERISEIIAKLPYRRDVNIEKLANAYRLVGIPE